MSSYGNTPVNQGQKRPQEGHPGEYLTEPSMLPPQPLPPPRGRRAAMAPPPQEPVRTPPVPPSAPGSGAQHGWTRPGPSLQTPQHGGWTPPGPAMPAAPQQSWSGSYAPQQGWQQPGAAPQTWNPGATPQEEHTQPSWPANNGYTPPVMPAPTEKQNGGNGGSSGNGWKLILLALVLVVIAVGAGFGIAAMSRQNKLLQEVAAYNERFCQGVYVDGIHLGGMTQDEAIAVVNAHAQERLAAWSISLTYGGQTVRRITAADLGMTINVHDALAAAWQQGHASSNVDERKAAMDALLETPYHGYTAMPSGDTSAIDRILNDLAAPVYRRPQDATVTFDPEAHSHPFEYTPEVYGSYLDVEPIKVQIYAMVGSMESGSIELVPQLIAPSVTEADLRRMRTLRGTATTDISTTSTPERTANIQRAFQLINGTVLAPGASFSFNGVVGARTAKNGFHQAIEYAYGTERMGYGGGVCQASTTIYLAAVRSNMTITKREPHSQKVNYTEYGLDATVNYDGKVIDLVFKNTTASDVYVMTYLERSGGRWICRVDIYGEALPEGVTYDLIAETVEVLPAPVDPEYVEDKDGEYVVYIDDKPVMKRKASDGYIVETFQVMYVNGKEVNRTYVARDTYAAKSQQLWVGIQERMDTWIP